VDGTEPSRRRLIAGGAVAAVLGVALVVLGTMVLGEAPAGLRVVVAGVGLVGAYLAADRLGRAAFGAHFEADFWLAVLWIGAVVLAAIFADLLPLAESRDGSKTLRTPTLLRPDLFSAHPLGTDRQGLDILGGVIYGARVSLVVSLGAVAIGAVIGAAGGILAGYRRGKIDTIVTLLSDSMLAFPPLILLLGMVTITSPTTRNLTIALGILGVPAYIRLARANTFVFSQREFVTASRALGERDGQIMLRELLPNVMLPVVSFSFLLAAVIVVAEASLSYLGLSLQRPTPTWGNMIATGQRDFQSNPHVVFLPGAALFVTVYSLNRIGDRARQIWDPRGSKL